MNRLIMSKDEILARKAERRRYLAGLSLGEKIARMEKLRKRVAPMRAARESRKAGAGKESEDPWIVRAAYPRNLEY